VTRGDPASPACDFIRECARCRTCLVGSDWTRTVRSLVACLPSKEFRSALECAVLERKAFAGGAESTRGHASQPYLNGFQLSPHHQ
jgi:hypothetical protein